MATQLSKVTGTGPQEAAKEVSIERLIGEQAALTAHIVSIKHRLAHAVSRLSGCETPQKEQEADTPVPPGSIERLRIGFSDQDKLLQEVSNTIESLEELV